MDNKEELLNRIKVLEHENKVLQNTINELQQEKHNLNSFFTPNIDLNSYVVGDIYSKFWSQPADNLWSQIEKKSWPPTPHVNFPLFASDGDYCSGFMASECSPEDYIAEERQKVFELKKKIEQLEQKMTELNSPLTHVAEAIKKRARFSSPAAAYELFEQMDYVFKDCQQWNENVIELQDFLLREKNRALLPPPTSLLCPTDQQMADAISSICGEGKALDEKQKWLGVCCLVRSKYNYPYDLVACCKRLVNLPYRAPLYKECDYGNVRKLAIYGFAREPYDRWKNYTPRDSEKKLFDSCFYVARELEFSIEKITNSN